MAVRPAVSAMRAGAREPARPLALHAVWLIDGLPSTHRLALWAEAAPSPSARKPRRLVSGARRHPAAAHLEELTGALQRLWRISRPSVKPRSAADHVALDLWLPTAAEAPLPSPSAARLPNALSAEPSGAAVSAPAFDRWRVDAVTLDAEAATTLLAGLPLLAADTCLPIPVSMPPIPASSQLVAGDDLRFWSVASRFALDLLVRQRYLPGAVQLPADPYANGYARAAEVAAFWWVALSQPEDRDRFEALAEAMPELCRACAPDVVAPGDDGTPFSPRVVLEDFLHTAVNGHVRHAVTHDYLWLRLPGPQRTSRSSYGSYGYLYGDGYSPGYANSYGGSLAARWLEGLGTPGRALYATAAEGRTLLEQTQRWHAGLAGVGDAAFRLCFRLVPPGTEDDAAVEDGVATEAAPSAPPAPPALPDVILLPAAGATDTEKAAESAAADDRETPAEPDLPWRLEYFMQAADDPSLMLPVADIWRVRGATARFLDRRFDAPYERVLTGLGEAARLFEPIQRSLRTAHPSGCDLTPAEAYGFLHDALPTLTAAGFGVQVPPWWRKAAVRPTARLTLRGGQPLASGLLGLDAIVEYDWRIALGGEELTPEELERLAALKEPLVRLRGRWVEVRPEQIEAIWRFRQRHGGKMSLREALQTALGGGLEDPDLAVEEVRAEEWIGELLGRLRGGDALAEVEPPAGLHGTLRPYQRRGLSWLSFLSRYGLGACLADDMGLGKCLLAGSEVSALSGPISIETLWAREHSAAEPDDDCGEWATLAQPVLINTFDGRDIVARPVRRIFRQHIDEPCVEVRLADGALLKSTRRHRYLTPRGWKMAGELEAGELVAVPARTPHIGANEMPPDVAELMAWQMAEGSEHQPFHHGVFHNSDQGVLSRFRELALSVGVDLPEPHQTKTSWAITSGRLFDIFEPWGYEWGRRSADKIVPQSVLEAPLESQRAFIAAMMDAEGHVSKTHCEIASASRSIMYGLRDMLRNFGIGLRIRVSMKAATNGSGIKRPYFIGTFGGNSAARFAEQFDLRIPKKQEALQRLAAVKHNSNVEGVPTQAVVAAMQERGIPLRSVGLRTVYEWQGMGRELAASVAIGLREKEHADLAQRIEDLAAPGVYWCQVKQVERFHHTGYVYDLEVPETHNYVANGIITHNTVQLLSLLQQHKEAGELKRPVLLVCPTSVVGNWRHEAEHFTPDLRVLIHHGAGRTARANREAFAAEAAAHDLVVTTYSLLPRDLETLGEVKWGAVVLDEAQNIKNADAKQSRAARKLQAPVRIALTGTPVENRLAELWSILDFLNPGYLGSHKRFNETLGAAVEQQRDPEATARLQALVRPFILRRLKTDPTVIADLPQKIEVVEHCTLTREQVTLYEATVRDGLRQIEQADEPMQRRGVILALLTRLKQVCNHPAHLLADGSALHGRSGKLIRLEELVDELLAEGDRALIFTQFTAFGERLQPYLAERFGVEPLYLHGGVPRAARERMVERFQAGDGPPLFLLSLKAGGTGLNLTAANHVIHYDRWWNPAVENQATDRAFRIGQRRNVQVRKLVCAGTLEERIDTLIERKRGLAEAVIGSGEGWLTELTTSELRDLFTLRRDALAP